jgi:nicotinate (nicotinamide) nucleotide adenylyltransferase
MKDDPIGIISGTFDPIHLGHLALADAAMNKFKLSAIYFAPEPEPRSKKPIASLVQRKKMLRLATKYNPKLKLLNLSSKTFSVDDFKELRSAFGKKKIYLIFGHDAYQNTKNWFKPEYQQTYNIQVIGFNRDEVAKGVSSKKIRDSMDLSNLSKDVADYIKGESIY